MTQRVVQGDCREVLDAEPEASFDAVVTDPPYGLSFMSAEWDTFVGFEEAATAWFGAVLRVCKPGAHLAAFGGTRTFHRLACALEASGWELRDTLCWLYGQGYPKSVNLGKDAALGDDWSGWGTALKPSWEPILLARKPLRGTVVANVAATGCVGLNIGSCRSERGRFPANALLGHSEDCNGSCAPECPVRLLDEQSGEREGMAVRQLRRGASTGRGLGFGSTSVGEAVIAGYDDRGGASRFFYTGKASTTEREDGLLGVLPCATCGGLATTHHEEVGADGEARSVRCRRNVHPTVKPLELMEWLIRLLVPPGGRLLDPFAGSGTTLVAARRSGVEAVGVELDDGYVRIARARIAATEGALL